LRQRRQAPAKTGAPHTIVNTATAEPPLSIAKSKVTAHSHRDRIDMACTSFEPTRQRPAFIPRDATRRRSCAPPPRNVATVFAAAEFTNDGPDGPERLLDPLRAH